MSGRPCAAIAVRVAVGSVDCVAHSTGSPDFAAQPAAGIAYSGWSAGATTTALAGLPAALATSLSISAASAAYSAPCTAVDLSPDGTPAAPILIACAPPSSREPVGA